MKKTSKRWHSIAHKKSTKAKNFISKKIKQLMDEGYPQSQAIVIAYSEARKKYPRTKGIQRYSLKKRKHEMTHSEWEYYGGKYSGEPEPKNKYY